LTFLSSHPIQNKIQEQAKASRGYEQAKAWQLHIFTLGADDWFEQPTLKVSEIEITPEMFIALTVLNAIAAKSEPTSFFVEPSAAPILIPS
jgi:hypothetical protein